jgi:hypothetical protein
VHYELWDTVSRNLLDDFATEAEALAAIGELLALNEPDIAEGLTLLRVGGPDGGATVASGTELAARALATASARGRLPA